MSERVVLCMKWGSVFSADYVNRLYRAVEANLPKQFRFVCLTDDPIGLNENICHFGIPDLNIPMAKQLHGAWPKLSVFMKDLYGLTGRALFIDLDSAIVSELGSFFEREHDFLAIGAGDDWRRNKVPTKPELATGVFAFNLGSHENILEAFLKDPAKAFKEYANEQQFVEAHLNSWEPWPDSWIESFKRHLCRPIGMDLMRAPHEPAATTKIVAFHGDPRPIDLIGRKGWWSKPPHSIRCPIHWLDEYWRKYSELS